MKGLMGATKKVKPMSVKAGLLFPVGRIKRMMKKWVRRSSKQSAVYLAAVMQYLTQQILTWAVQAVKKDNKKRIMPRQLLQAFNHDAQLQQMAKDVIIPGGGAFPEKLGFDLASDVLSSQVKRVLSDLK